MKYKKEINVFSTSPVDIKEEHNIISAVCDELNKNALLNSYGITFQDTGWRDVFPAPGNPQEIINKLLDECDIFVCIFHKRFGSFSGNEESLALKEFLIAYEKWKSYKKPYIMFYFKRVEVNSLHELKDPQLMKVFDLKEKINKEAMLIFGEFKHPEDFRERFLKDLKSWIVQNAKNIDEIEKTEPEKVQRKIQSVPVLYQKWINDHCNFMEFNALRAKDNNFQFKLSEVYIPLNANAPVKHSMNVGCTSQGDHDLKEEQIDLEKLVSSCKYLLIEGNPGSGKSTFLKHLSYKLIQKSNISGLENFLPVLIFLKDLKEFLDNQELKSKASTVESILKDYFENTENGLDLETVLTFCKAKSAIFFLDGLDEIKQEYRDIVVKSFADFMVKHEGNKLVVSGRPHSMEGAVIDIFGEWKVTIQSLNSEQIENFIKKWSKCIDHKCSKLGMKSVQDIISEIKYLPEIQQSVDLPLMLTAICILYYEGKGLPGQRTELYNKFIKNLLARRFNKPETIYDFLKTLAFQMNSIDISGADRVFATKILRSFYKIWGEETEQEYKQRIDREFDRIQNDCGILKYENGQYSFSQLSFCKFLTAAFMVDEIIDQTEITTTYLDNNKKREIFEFFIGYLSIFNKGLANQIVGEVINAEDHEPYERWMLASKSLVDIQDDRRQTDVLNTARKRLLSIINDGGVKPEILVEAGETLGWIGDSRELDEFIPIAGGTYTLNLNIVTLERFEIGKYPVTNKWFLEFIKEGGYENRDYWSDEGRKWLDFTKATQPALWNYRKWKCPNSPVIGVSWYESYAFTRWLTLERNDGYEYKLLDENEWEAIASGGCWAKGKKYPWGDVWDKNCCNSSETKIKSPSPVGIFKNGETIDGISDLCGNVWEWTTSDFHSHKKLNDFLFNENILETFNSGTIGEYSTKPDNETNLPVLRGGSYLVERDFCSCSFRSWFYPYIRYEDIGFRCARTKKS